MKPIILLNIAHSDDTAGKCSPDGKYWVSTADSNVWQPGGYGWEEMI